MSCVREDEIHGILKACHDEPCGVHFADKRTGHKALRMGYFLPTIIQYAKNYSQAYDSYQRIGQPNKLDEISL